MDVALRPGCGAGNGTPDEGSESSDPHRYIDGPKYFSVTLGPNLSTASMMLLMPELREVIGFDRLITFVRRVIDDGLMTSRRLE